MDSLLSGIINFKQAQTISQVQTAVAKKILDNQELQGNAAIQLLQKASETANTAGDALVAASTGLGGSIDASA